MTWLASLTWVQGCMLIMAALITFAAICFVADAWRSHRRYRRSVRINPLFTVGRDVKPTHQDVEPAVTWIVVLLGAMVAGTFVLGFM